MTSRFVLVAFLFVASVSLSAYSLSVELKQQSVIRNDGLLASRAVQFSNTSFCFHTVASGSEEDDAKPITHCTFDSGATFTVVETTRDVCLSGILVDEIFFCPGEIAAQSDEGDVEYATISFEARVAGIHERIDERRLIFRGGKTTGILRHIWFNGDTIRLDEEDRYMMVSTVVNEADEKKAVVFRSEDGFVYDAVSVIPGLEAADMYHLIHEGGRKLSVLASFGNRYYAGVSSGYGGRYWSTLKVLNISAPPTSVVFSSGVLMQYSCSNETSRLVRWYYSDEKDEGALATDLPGLPATGEHTRTSLLAFAVESSKAGQGLVVLRNEIDADGNGKVWALSYDVDDSVELKKKTDRIAKEKEAWLKKEAARFKARQERLEREKSLRRERRRKTAEKKTQFILRDKPNVQSARSLQERDGELIVVRRVEKDTIPFEREVFLSDL